MEKREETNTLVLLDGWRSFLIYKTFKAMGFELNFAGLIQTILTALATNLQTHFVNKLGFRTAFIGLPKTIEDPILKEFLSKLQENNIIISSAPLEAGKEKGMDSRLQEYCTNMVTQVEKIILISGDGDFANFIKELKLNYNKDTILVSTELPEHNLHLSKKLIAACSDYIDLSKLTANSSIFTPVKNVSRLQNTIIQTSEAKAKQQKTPLITQMQNQQTSGRKTYVVVKKAVFPKLSTEVITKAINYTIAYKERRCSKRPSWISLDSLQKSLSLQGFNLSQIEIYRQLLLHKENFFVSTYRTAKNETLTTVSVIKQQQVNYAV